MKTTTNGKQLDEQEWSFHKIPKAELRAAWLWELDRTLGSGGEPWLALHDDIKRRIAMLVPRTTLPALDDYSLARATPDFVNNFERVFREIPEHLSHSIGHHRLHLLHVDWSCSKTKILRELNQWAEKQLKAVPPSSRRIDKGGRKEQFGAWLTDLAIYRASEAGMTRVEAVKILRPLLSGSLASTAGKTSPSHWEDAQKITRKRLLDRRIDLEVRAIGLREQAGSIAFPKSWQGYLLTSLLLRRQGELISDEYENVEESA